MNRRARAILWVDGGAACAAGVTVLALRERLVRLEAFPLALVIFLGLSNLAYASYSGSLATLASLNKTPVKERGLDEVRKIAGYHDEPLRGDRKGQRSIRLSKSWRAFYVIVDGKPQFVEVIDVNHHEY